MALGIPIILAGVGILGLLAMGSRTAAAAPTTPGPTPGPSPTSGTADMPLALKQQMAEALRALGVDAMGNITGTPTAAAVQAATTLAATLQERGYPEAAAALREFARTAATMIVATPPIITPPPAADTSLADLLAQVDRAAKYEGDPDRIQAVLNQVMIHPRVNDPTSGLPMAVQILSTKIAQIRRLQAAAAAVERVDAIIRVDPGETQASPPVPAPPTPSTPPTTPALPTPISVPIPVPAPKTAAEMAAENMVRHLNSLLASKGGDVKKAKGSQDQTLVKRFQELTNAKQDGKPGPGTLVAAAQQGQGTLPLVFYWPTGATTQKVVDYRNALAALAQEAAQRGDVARAANLIDSANRERGQAGIVGNLAPKVSANPYRPGGVTL